jgi:hypothetical protein
MKNALKNCFTIFQEGYTKRDVDFLKTFMDTLFEEGKKINVIGTGNAEIYQSKEQVQDLFSGDWLYWGDLKIKMDSMVHQQIEKHDLFVVWGDLVYTYEIKETTDASYYGFIKKILEEANVKDLSHIKHQEHKAHYVLDHYLHDRQGKKRTEPYPLVMVFLFEQVKEDYYLRALTFTNPPNGQFPDERMHPFTTYSEDHKRNLKQIEEKGHKNEHPSFLEMDQSSDFVFLDVDGLAYEGEKARNHYQERRTFYDSMHFKEDSGLLYQKDNLYAWTFLGHTKKVMQEESLRRKLHQEIMEIFEKDLSEKEKMFNIRRQMSFYEKEISLGPEFLWPFRAFVVYEKKDRGYLLKMVQFSYPMDLILEGKYA